MGIKRQLSAITFMKLYSVSTSDTLSNSECITQTRHLGWDFIFPTLFSVTCVNTLTPSKPLLHLFLFKAALQLLKLSSSIMIYILYRVVGALNWSCMIYPLSRIQTHNFMFFWGFLRLHYTNCLEHISLKLNSWEKLGNLYYNIKDSLRLSWVWLKFWDMWLKC